MSVLNGIITTCGDGLKEVARGLNNSKAKRVFKVCKSRLRVRLDKIEFGQRKSEIGSDVVNLLGPRWQGEDDVCWWGTPSGSLAELVDRLEPLSEDPDNWCPSTDLIRSEQEARDLTAASTLFQFRMGRHKSDVNISHGILPVLESEDLEGWKVMMGTEAVAYAISSIAEKSGISSELADLKRKDADSQPGVARDLAQWTTLMQVVCSTNSADALKAAQKVGKLGLKSFEEADQYIRMADFANVCKSACRSATPKGKATRRMKKHAADITDVYDKLETHKKRGTQPLPNWSKDAEELLSEVSHQATARTLPTNRGLIYSVASSPGIRIIPAQNVCLVCFPLQKVAMLLTTPDMDNLKFVAMSHSLWHFYKGSISMEYIKSAVSSEDLGDPLVAQASAAAGEINRIIRQLLVRNQRVNESGQKIVPEAIVIEGLDRVWTLYRRILKQSILLKKQDYLGRYVHELFEVYTSVLGGHLAKTGADAQKAELIATYEPLGFRPTEDCADMESVFSSLPMSAIQDFGRLSKIVYAYDVDHAYSFLDRANKMCKPNPIGKGIKRGEYEYDVQPFSQQENVEREARFRSAARVMLAAAHVKSMMLANLAPEKLEEYRSLEWDQLLRRLRDANVVLQSAVQVSVESDLQVPPTKVEEALRQAREFVSKHVMPTEPYAGAYLDIVNIMPYRERGEPDLALIKATSLAPLDYQEAFSSGTRDARTVVARGNLGRRRRPGGDMATDFLTGNFPSRRQALAHVASGLSMASTSAKVETNKYPLKTREITSFEGASRRVQGEYEHNNGLNLADVPGFTVGEDPNEVRKKIYAGLRDDLSAEMTRLFISLDLSGWSSGMHWDIQKWTNFELSRAYDGGKDMFKVVEKGTLGALVYRVSGGLRLAFRNVNGANFEGIDGKRNTFMHSTMWFLARCDAYSDGVTGTMRAFLYIDDGAAILECAKTDVNEYASKLRHWMITTYTAYGFKLSLLKTVVSEVYMQFLNEVYFHGIHIGYGFRALCHTGAQEFPPLATVREELDVIYGGIKGATVSGGHPLRLLAGLGYILHLYMNGVIGSVGKALRGHGPVLAAVLLHIPTVAGGFGMPGMTGLFSNLEGHPDIEKLAKVRLISRLMVRFPAPMKTNVAAFMKGYLMLPQTTRKADIPDRVRVPHVAMVSLGECGRTKLIAESALKITEPPAIRSLLSRYIESGGKLSANSFAGQFVKFVRENDVIVPQVLAEKAFATDERAAMATLITKIASSRLVERYLSIHQRVTLRRKYFRNAKTRMDIFARCME